MGSLRSVSEAIRRRTPDDGVESRCAEALLILGLEGSRDECSTLWVFNAAIQSMKSEGETSGQRVKQKRAM
jgi:hypothetical protein